jgi:hypothetical protein
MKPTYKELSLAAVLLVTASPFITGCDSDCVSLCEDTKECAGASAETKSTD